MVKGLTQEDFSVVSSRTYLSSLERGLKSPTLDKLQALAQAMEVHPLTLLVLAYVQLEGNSQYSALLDKVGREIEGLFIK